MDELEKLRAENTRLRALLASRSVHSSLLEEHRDEILAAIREGKTYTQIAKDYNTTGTTVRKFCLAAGVASRSSMLETVMKVEGLTWAETIRRKAVIRLESPTGARRREMLVAYFSSPRVKYKELGVRFGVAAATVRTHVENEMHTIREALGVENYSDRPERVASEAECLALAHEWGITNKELFLDRLLGERVADT